MDNGEVLVVVVIGLCAGYRAVSMLMRSRPGPPAVGSAAEILPSGAPGALPWHVVLDVSPHAGEHEIRAAYRSLMGQYHPDKVATLGLELRQLAERKSREIGAAYSAGLRAQGIDG